MPGGFFRHLGSSIPTNTVWFGAIIDRLNMLVPNASDDAGFSRFMIANATPIPAHYGNLWRANACSFGATTTAPDGTSANSQAIVEDNSNGTHFISSTICNMLANSPTGRLRLVGIYKNNGRRVVLQAVNGSSGSNTAIYAIFDLAGGQIGVGPTLTATGGAIQNCTSLGATMSALGNGWYICAIDFSFNLIVGGQAQLCMQAYLDNGTGSAALSNSYLGNSSSGVFVWRTNLMHVGAYAINNQVFLDDFTSTSTIDLTNSLSPSFTWFVRQGWTNVHAVKVTPANAFSVSSSVLTINPANVPAGSIVAMGTTAETGVGTWVGQTWRPPYLMEARCSWGVDIGAVQVNATPIWGITQEWISAEGPSTTNPTVFYGRELDWGETGANSPTPNTNIHQITAPINGPGGNPGELSPGVQGYTSCGTPNFLSVQPYNPGFSVMSAGTRYINSAGTSAGVTPPSAPWAVSPYPANAGIPYMPNVAFDYTVMHLYSFLVLPYFGSSQNVPGSPEQAGVMLTFCDGLMVSWNAIYGPQQTNGYQYMTNSDGLTMPIWVSGDSPGGAPIHLDYIKVMQ